MQSGKQHTKKRSDSELRTNFSGMGERRTPEKGKEEHSKLYLSKLLRHNIFSMSTVFVATRCFLKLEEQTNKRMVCF